MKLEKYYRYFLSGINVLFKPLSVNTNPIYVQMEPTSYCNLACKFCGREKAINKPEHLSLEDFKKFIDVVKPMKLAMSGSGEPMINPDLFDMVRHAKESGCSVLTTSNMTLVDDAKALNIVESGLDLLKISIDAATRETYEKVRGEDYFDKILDGIDKINRVKAEKSSKTPIMRFQFVIQGENFEEIPALINLAAEKSVDAIYLQPLGWMFVEDKKDELLEGFSRTRLKEILVESTELARDKGIVINSKRLLSDFELFFREETYHTSTGQKRICIMPWFSLYLSGNGDIRACCTFQESVPFLGNIKDEDFENIWNSKEYKKFRKSIRKGDYKYVACKGCNPPVLKDLVSFRQILPGFFKFFD